MRLTEHQYAAICKYFSEFFFEGDALWLFGSRVDDAKRGGDIDLYIETYNSEPELLYQRRTDFSRALQNVIGAQKIDVVINIVPLKKQIPIYQEARQNGVFLMKKEIPLEHHLQIADLHASRLSYALQKTHKKYASLPGFLKHLSDNDIAPFDMMAMRYQKLQDLIGSKIFPIILELIGQEAITFIDKLNKLEKFGYLDDASWWSQLRELRNRITHEYSAEDLIVEATVKETIREAGLLLAYWQRLKPRLEALLEQVKKDQQKTPPL